MKTMTPEEMRLAIAEKRGCPKPFHNSNVPERRGEIYDGNWMPLPDYPASLDAVSPVARSLAVHLRYEYTRALRAIVVRDATSGMNDPDSGLISDVFFYEATALQRCEALCRVWFPERFE
jgi:hypothetical protein